MDLFSRITCLLQPEGRAIAVANSVQQFLSETGLSVEDYKAGLEAAKNAPDGLVLAASEARRSTVGELLACLGDVESGDVSVAKLAWVAFADKFEISDDPRQRAMGETARRESNAM